MHDGVEAIVSVGAVLHSTTNSVRLHQAVASADDVSASSLVMFLVVPSVGIVHTIGEAVLWRAVATLHGCGDGCSNGGGVSRGDSSVKPAFQAARSGSSQRCGDENAKLWR